MATVGQPIESGAWIESDPRPIRVERESGAWVESDPLSIMVERDPAELYVLGFYGEFDLAGAEIAEGSLRRAAESDAKRIIVDLSGLDFIDSHGLRVLMEAHHRERGADRLVFLRGTGQVERVFAVTQLDSRLPFAD